MASGPRRFLTGSRGQAACHEVGHEPHEQGEGFLEEAASRCRASHQEGAGAQPGSDPRVAGPQERPVEVGDWRKNVEAMSGMEGRKKMFDAAKSPTSQ